MMVNGKGKIVIVGGVAAGGSAAAKARRVNEAAEIVVFEKGGYVSFANCGLPYHIGGQIKDRDELFLVTPERFWERFRVNVRTNCEVVSLDRTRHTVRVYDLNQDREYEESYDKLILAPGARPTRLPVPGTDLEGIFTLWSVPDMDAILRYIQVQRPERALVVGAGFVGLEMVEALLDRGCKVALVEALPQVLPVLDEEMTLPLARHLEELGVDVLLETRVERFEPCQGLGGAREPSDRARVGSAVLDDGTVLPCELVILAVGVRPNTDLARAAEIALGEHGGILVNSKMQTSDPDIYAAGDVVESKHWITGQRVWAPLAGPANKQGRVAGANAALALLGVKDESLYLHFQGTLGTTIIKVGKMTAAKTGLSEREARRAGLRYYVSYTPSPDHATYYPGAEIMMIKTLFSRDDSRVLGAQIVGTKGVDKRIDVLATAIRAQFTAEDLEQLDLAYAPPYSSAKDPVIMAGMVGANIARGDMEVITPGELRDWLRAAGVFKSDQNRQQVNAESLPQIVDVRTPDEYRHGNIPGSVNIPLEHLRERLGELDPNQPTVVYCLIGYRAYLAYRILKQHGFKSIKNLSGGMRAWSMRLKDK